MDNRMDITQYLHGDCHLFAIALHTVFNYEIELCMDNDDLEYDGEILVHAYCKHKGCYIDVRGIIDNIDDLLTEYDYNTTNFIQVDKSYIESLIDNQILHNFEYGQLDNIISHINKHKKLYRMEK